jgi:hypothetical protein
MERLNSDSACEICQPYHPLNSIFRLHIRIAHIINNLLILRPYLPLTFSAQNPDDHTEEEIQQNLHVLVSLIHQIYSTEMISGS